MPSTIPAGPRAYTGTRVVTVTGKPPTLSPGAASYTATAVETDLAPGNGAPAGTTIDQHLLVAYSGSVPSTGTQAQSETLDRYLAAGSAGVSLVGLSDVNVALDPDANLPGAQMTDTRAVTTTFASPAPIVPAAIGTAPSFPLAARLHLVERNVDTTGPSAGGENYSADYTRAIAADGTFDETGTNDVGASHAKHQNADGSATSHDQWPGFSLRDVSISAPSPGASGLQLAVTLQTQGRDLGNPPIVSSTYTTPVWYAPGALASATLYDSVGTLPAACGLSTPATARRLNLAQTAVDVAAGTRVVINDQNYVDANGITVCRAVSTITSVVDVTTGALTAMVDDELTLHYTGSAQASSLGRRGTR
jgi:hypothetical protein